MVRIVQQIAYVSIATGGGAPRSAISIAALMRDRGHEVTILISKNAIGRDLHRRIQSSELRCLPQMTIPWSLVPTCELGLEGRSNRISRLLSSATLTLKQILCECTVFVSLLLSRADVYYVSNLASIAGISAASLLRIPTVIHLREYLNLPDGYSAWPSNHAVLSAINKCDLAVCVSEDVQEYYAEQFGITNTVVVRNAVFDPSATIPCTRLFTTERVRITLLGSIQPLKGQLCAVEAMRQVIRDGHKVELSLWGPVVDEDYLDELTGYIFSNGLDAFVKYHGITDDPQLVFASTDIALVCTSREPFGRVTVEALAAGCVVIGSNSGGTQELLANGLGLLYEEGDSVSLGKAIGSAIDHRTDWVDGQMARREVALREYSLNRLGAEMNEVFLEVLNKHQYDAVKQTRDVTAS